MEEVIKLFVSTLFGAGVACFFAGSGLLVAAGFSLTPEAFDRCRLNPLNRVLSKDNLTPRGQWCRRMALKCFLGFVVPPLVAMVGGVLLMLLSGIEAPA